MDYIDIYCERIAPGLLAEPVNAITNLSFFVAAFFVFKLGRDAGVMALGLLMVFIGTGSSLFHTHATHVTQLMDVIPILLFQMSFIWLYCLRVMKINAAKTAMLFLVFLVLSYVCDQIPSSILNGSTGYIPALLFVTGFGVWHFKNVAQDRLVLLEAAGIFIVSLTFRSLDMMLCSTWPLGTHFMWHCLNGAVLYLSARAYYAGAGSPKTDV